MADEKDVFKLPYFIPKRPNRRKKPNRPGRPSDGPFLDKPISPTPEQPIFNTPSSRYQNISVKPATPDIIVFDEELIEVDVMADLLFEDIGGQELINITRNDIINGQSVAYHPIRNVSQLANKYNPQNILYIPQTAFSFFNNFPLKFVNYLPNVGTGPNGESAYLDEGGNLIINLVNMKPNEEVEVQVFDRPNIFNDTIYEGDL